MSTSDHGSLTQKLSRHHIKDAVCVCVCVCVCVWKGRLEPHPTCAALDGVKTLFFSGKM